jgi:HEAT repeat protein
MVWMAWQTFYTRALPEDARLEALLGVQQYNLTDAGRHHLYTVACDTTESDRIRAAVVMVLGNSFSPYHPVEAWTWLLPFLEEATQSPLMRRCAIQTIIDSQNPDLIPWLLPCLSHQDKQVFADASEALGQFGYAVVPHLATLLADPLAPPDVQCVAAWQLGELKTFQAVQILLPLVIDTQRHTDVRALSIWALGQLGQSTPELLAALQQCLTEDEPDIRLRAQTAIKKIQRNSN